MAKSDAAEVLAYARQLQKESGMRVPRGCSTDPDGLLDPIETPATGWASPQMKHLAEKLQQQRARDSGAGIKEPPVPDESVWSERRPDRERLQHIARMACPLMSAALAEIGGEDTLQRQRFTTQPPVDVV
eukprot:TRINITY_DN19088_c0_g1_i1.p1 TRINITY_DN19088_c0_g1~~TRINITY_DN19088_c0_g1_i1.p1  ORF type:complete len:130 (+),score=23.88 TRINITY_DN19088_c0_g1_i1:8-397(+)